MGPSASDEKASPRVDELIERTSQFVTRTLTDTIERPVRRVGRRLGGRLVRFALGATLLICAAGFLLFGFMSLLTLWLPLFGACLLVGGFALLLGLLFLKV
ncbi:MAG: hypothetical protein IT381_08910 [Deltaproteobacteria bacterium]|nr:hypothetical protein [Deltaproteobacteria bacterium]